MDADERLTALKKAYADIILNTAKEAAARIMVSERKALRFQQELFVAKEEALQMMLRLKQMMDFKIGEAATASLSQHKKIEELEAQLQEAEDIVNELRQELREVQFELEKAINDKEQSIVTRSDIADEKRFTTSQSITENGHESISKPDEDNKCYNESYIGNLELPSIILRSKEPEPYRNGCTQRICAFERNETQEDERICTPSTRDGEDNDKSNVEKYEEARLTSWKQVRSIKSIRRNGKKARSYNRKKRTPSSRGYKETKSDLVTPLDVLLAEAEASLGESPKEDPSLVDPGISLEKNNSINNGVSTESFGIEVNEKVDDVALVKSEAEDEAPDQPAEERIIRYERKRKRGCLTLTNSEGNGSSTGKAALKRKSAEKEKINGSLESQKSALVPESSRDSRRLAQVARQLISLSEKKW